MALCQTAFVLGYIPWSIKNLPTPVFLGGFYAFILVKRLRILHNIFTHDTVILLCAYNEMKYVGF